MLENLGSIFTWVVGFAIIAATTVAFFRANLAKTQIELLKGENEANKEKADRLKRELDEEREKRVLLAQEVQNLRSIVTGKEQLNHLQKQLDAHDKRVDERHRHTDGLLEHLLNTMNTNLDTTEKNKDTLHEIMLDLRSKR